MTRQVGLMFSLGEGGGCTNRVIRNTRSVNFALFFLGGRGGCSVICGVCLCYCDVRPHATVHFLGRDDKVILNLDSQQHAMDTAKLTPCL